ncbi:MAG: hypothetical protein ACREDJ_10925 [Methylocella sp.]
MRQRISLLGGLAIPFQRLGIVARDSFASLIHLAEAPLRRRVALLGLGPQSVEVLAWSWIGKRWKTQDKNKKYD